MILSIILILFLALPCYGETFTWSHDCSNTTGFKVYYGKVSGQNTHLVATVLCPEIHVTVSPINQGYYICKAYNQYGESDPSNEVLWAGYYYNTTRFEYDSSGLKILYKGEHIQQDASVDDTNWIITKYYWSDSVLIQTRIRTTSWTNRAVGW